MTERLFVARATTAQRAHTRYQRAHPDRAARLESSFGVRAKKLAILAHISTGFEYIGKCPLHGMHSTLTPPASRRGRYDNPVFCSPYINNRGIGSARNFTANSPPSDNSTIDLNKLGTASARTLDRRLAAYSEQEKNGECQTRSTKASKKFCALFAGNWKIWRLRKQSSGARLPSMLTRLRIRLGSSHANSSAVSPPME